MEANNFEETLKQLESRVDKLSGIPTEKAKSSQFLSFKGITINKRLLLWFGIPIAIMAVLLVLKPKIVREEVVDEDGTVYEKVSKKRALVATLFITSLIIGGYFVWKYKKSRV